MTTIDKRLQLKASATYNAAADRFDAPPLGFWNRHGCRAVEILDLEPGHRVLDLGCGTGASALPAAAAVGPRGMVVGLDVAQRMLERAWIKARQRGLENVDFRFGDMAASGLPPESFDAVISVFSVFFVSDMKAQIREFWRLVRPGGKLIVTVWGPGAFQPAARVFGDVLRSVRPDSPDLKRPWERLTPPGALQRLFEDAGVGTPDIHVADDRQELETPADWWKIAMGSGFRWEIDQLAPAERNRLRTRLEERLAVGRIDAIETGAIHGIAVKPA